MVTTQTRIPALGHVLCWLGVHSPTNYDPTGGAPHMGGPVYLTRCFWCKERLEDSDAARLHNQYIARLRDDEAGHRKAIEAVWVEVAKRNTRNTYLLFFLILSVMVNVILGGWLLLQSGVL